MDKPISKESLSHLCDVLGNSVQEMFPLLQERINSLAALNNMLSEGRIDQDSFNNYKNILELHASVLYAIIEVGIAFRADLHSEKVIEKRINLKYIVFIISEFFKATFTSSNGMWNKVSEYLLSSDNNDDLNETINCINDHVNTYKNIYYDKDKEKRDISVHYDFDINKLYKYLVDISEEAEAKRLCHFLSIVQPLNKLLLLPSTILIAVLNKDVKTGSFATEKDDIIFRKFKNDLYPKIGDSLQTFSTILDKNMRVYNMPENLPKELLSSLGDNGLTKIKEILDKCKLGILLPYIYLDLGTAIRGYIKSESNIEKRWNLIRINLIIYEGWKKIYVPENAGEKSLWEKNIYESIPLEYNDLKKESDSVEQILNSYENNNIIKSIRHYYIHLREKRAFNLPFLLDELSKLNEFNELAKVLDFINILPNIYKLSDAIIRIDSAQEDNKYKQELLEPINKIKQLIGNSNMPEKDKDDCIKQIDNGHDELKKLFD
ncbi:hypothetical protein prwr041_22470 [Prevotella herbatica]|uniref:Uncharacterized protein n=1 Tax=Prevotella herbatica TaxID=2801997 RepID=A0ABN6ELH5_9BACT|nr:hypothetical protein [Prevotella herbatica]BCS86354.1 hypothetical protein prwr041_22470 [Prevotella herbatica]